MNVTRVIQLLDRLSDLGFGLGLGVCEERLRPKFLTLGLPEGLAYLFASHWPQTPGLAHLNGYSINCSGQLLSVENKEELLPVQLFAIGDASNGDTLALDLSLEDPSVVVLNHEVADTPRSKMARVCRTLEDFLLAALNEEPLPTDYYEAVSFARDNHD